MSISPILFSIGHKRNPHSLLLSNTNFANVGTDSSMFFFFPLTKGSFSTHKKEINNISVVHLGCISINDC